MKVTKTLKATLAKAQDLQRRYRKMGAPHTQNVRNPYPMHILVASILPELPDRGDSFTVKAKLTAFGKKFTKHVEVTAEDALGHDFWDKRALTVEQVCDTLRSAGFLAKEITVRQTLSNLRRESWTHVESTTSRKHAGMGRPKSLYFVRS